ncbi:MAG: YcxB family protein [Sulfitobacter sp.]
MTYNLTFEIAPDLYRRAVTTPITGAPSKNRVMVQNIAAALLFPASVSAFNRALFDPDSLIAMLFAAVLGAGLVLAVWWHQHRRLVGIHGRFNETGGTQTIQIDADGIIAQRPNIKSEMSWPFVKTIRQIEAATLIELPTARLIVPDDALPDGTDKAAFLAQLMEWKAA